MRAMTNFRKSAELEVVSAIRSLRESNGYCPSFREVATESGLPLGTVHSVCIDLAARGLITYHPRIARSLDVVTSA